MGVNDCLSWFYLVVAGGFATCATCPLGVVILLSDLSGTAGIPCGCSLFACLDDGSAGFFGNCWACFV